MDLKFTLPVFEGPLDLLLHLIEKNKIDIYDIPIAMITDQYFEYLHAMEDVDLDIMSDFLVMAATLLDIKSRMLLPREEEPEEEGDPRRELVERLLEYKRFKVIGGELRDLGVEGEKTVWGSEQLPEEVAKYKPPVDLDQLIGDLNTERLHDIFIEVIARNKERVNETVKNYGQLRRETIPIESRISHVRKSLSGGRRRSFRAMLSEGASKEEIIVTFLAILELLRMGEIKLTEDSTADDFSLEGTDGKEQSNN